MQLGGKELLSEYAQYLCYSQHAYVGSLSSSPEINTSMETEMEMLQNSYSVYLVGNSFFTYLLVVHNCTLSVHNVIICSEEAKNQITAQLTCICR